MKTKQKTGRPIVDLSGRRFGKLIAVAPIRLEGKRMQWRCMCDCGTEHITNGTRLVKGVTKSCGCYRAEIGPQTGASALRKEEFDPAIGFYTKHPLYSLWWGIKYRCYNPNHVSYERYGARGIAMCDQWRNSFPAFVRDVGERPSQHHSIDRIDPNGDYEAQNIRWATDKEQAANRR